MGRKLNTFVHVDGKQYGPDDDIPADVEKQITNPDVWANPDTEDVTAAEDSSNADTPEDPNRPRGNASREDWANYAASLNPRVEVTDDMSRDDIKTAVDNRR